MNNFRIDDSVSFAIITPSYHPDFQRCQLLCRSIERFLKPPFHHYIAVEKRDFKLFSQLQNDVTDIVLVEDLLPPWIFRVPKLRRAWLSLKTLPIRNWIMQQITKISLAREVNETVLIFLDSDEMFIRPFDLRTLIKDDLVRFYSEPGGNPIGMDTPHELWHQSASKLLGLEPTPMPAPDYIADIITWKKDNVLSMCEYIEYSTDKSWLRALSQTWHLSEYTLYGTYIDRILGAKSGHYSDSIKILNSYYHSSSMSEEELVDFVKSTRPEHVAIMISAKAKMAVERYASLLKLD